MKEEFFLLIDNRLVIGPLSQAQIIARLRKGVPDNAYLSCAGSETISVSDRQGMATLFGKNSELKLQPLLDRKLSIIDLIRQCIPNILQNKNFKILFIFALFWFLSRSMWTSESDWLQPPDQKLHFETQLRALAIESMSAYHAALSSKLQRDNVGYTRALLRLDASRNTFSDGMLPSQAFIAGVALLVLTAEELDNEDLWRPFLQRLGAETRKGLGVLAYEMGRTRKLFSSALAAAQYGDGIKNQGGLSAKSLWGKNSFAGLHLSNNNARQDWEILISAMSRISEVYASVSNDETVFRSQYLARALWYSLQYSWLAGSKLQVQKQKSALLQWQNLIKNVTAPDREFLAIAFEERLASLEFELKPTDVIRERQKVFTAAQDAHKFFCNPKDTAIGIDFALQTMRISELYSLNMEHLSNTLNSCVIGARAFFPTQKFSFDSENGSILSFLPRATPSQFSIKAHENIFGRTENFGNFVQKGLKGNASWRIWAWLSASTSPKIEIDLNQFSNKCKSKKISTELCLQIAWRLSRSGDEKIGLIPQLAEAFSFAEAGQLALQLASDLYTEKTNISGLKSRPEIEGAIKAHLSQYLTPKISEYSALEWYAQNVFSR